MDLTQPSFLKNSQEPCQKGYVVEQAFTTVDFICFFNFNQVDKTVIFFSIFVEKFKDKTIYILRKEVKAFTMFTLQIVCMLFQ